MRMERRLQILDVDRSSDVSTLRSRSPGLDRPAVVDFGGFSRFDLEFDRSECGKDDPAAGVGTVPGVSRR
jgi:hypothetical protein